MSTEASPASSRWISQSTSLLNKRQQFPSVRFSFSNQHANVQKSRAWAETPDPLQGTRSSKTSCNKLSTINNLYIRNQKKPLQKTTESIAQYSYRAYPLAKSNDMKLKKVKRKLQHNPAISIVPTRLNKAENTREVVLSRHPPPTCSITQTHVKTEPRRQKIRTGPPPTPAKRPNILVPARHSTQRRRTNANM